MLIPPSHKVLVAGGIAIGLFISGTALYGAPGFGIRKKEIGLQVRRPAVVRLAATSVAFRSKAASTEYTPVLGSLQSTLESELLGNEPTLTKVSEGTAAWILEVTVTGYSVPPAKQRTQPVKNSTLTYARWTGSLNVAYQVLDNAGGVKDANNVSASYDKEFQTNAPQGGWRIPGMPGGNSKEPVPQTVDDVKQILIADVVHQMATNLGNTVETVETRVAVGQDNLERSATFIEQRLWARALEELEKTPAFAKPEDESYRQYNLGLSYEGMSYEGKVYSEQRANLLKAQEHYDNATELNRDERYFVAVIARLKDSVARYRMLDSMQQEDQKKRQATARGPAGSAPKPAAPAPPAAESAAAPAATRSPDGGAKPVTLADVVRMRAGRVPDARIIELIRVSPVIFALDVETLLTISQENVPVTIQNELRKKAGLPPVTAPRAAAPRAATPASGAKAETTKPVATPAK